MNFRPDIRAHCQDAISWLRHRGWQLGSLTAQDLAVLVTISHCWQLWVAADETGRRLAIDAAAALLEGCQECVWPMARELIAQAGDWNHRDLVWMKVAQQYKWRIYEQGKGRAPSDLPALVKADEAARRMARCHVGVAQVQP